MSVISRRSFLHIWKHVTGQDAARTTPQSTPQPAQAPQAIADSMCLPPDFSPPLLRAEGQRLGLPVDQLREEELALAVLQAMHRQA